MFYTVLALPRRLTDAGYRTINVTLQGCTRDGRRKRYSRNGNRPTGSHDSSPPPTNRVAQVMTASRVGVTAGLCDLVTGMTSGPGCATFGANLPIELEKLYVYSLIWSVGGLLEFEDRCIYGGTGGDGGEGVGSGGKQE